MVLLKFKNEVSRETISRIAEDLKALKGKLEGLIDISIGENFSERSKGFNVGLVVRFSDEKSLGYYQNHPEHLKILTEQIRPNVDDVIAVDYHF